MKPLAPAFDNRLTAQDLRPSQAGRWLDHLVFANGTSVRGAHHYRFEVGGCNYAYTYIRKNACTAFKNFLAELAGANGQVAQDDKIHLIKRELKIRRRAELQQANVAFFVYRDPVQRFCSLYKNKFIARDGHEKLFDNVRALSGLEPDTLSAERVLGDFVAGRFGKRRINLKRAIDSHFLPQQHYLAPIRYDMAIHIDALEATMSELLSPLIGHRYFGKCVNSTRAPTYTQAVHDQPSLALHRHYLETGEMPSDAALVTPAMVSLIRALYHDDYTMIDTLEGNRQTREMPSAAAVD